jgi:hypothetical protein
VAHASQTLGLRGLPRRRKLRHDPSAALADKLQSVGVALSGLILISCAMDLQSIVFAPANDLPYSLFLPAYANVSQYQAA